MPQDQQIVLAKNDLWTQGCYIPEQGNEPIVTKAILSNNNITPLENVKDDRLERFIKNGT